MQPMTTTPTTSSVPRPAGASHVGERRLDSGTARRFWGVERVTVNKHGDDVRAEVAGEQWRDGRTDRWVVINGNLFLYADEARQVGTQLLAAADEMDAAR
jgi:hypothetical protein